MSNDSQAASPTPRPRTHVVIVLDRSSSMRSLRSKAIELVNSQLDVAKKFAVDQDVTFSLITFADFVDAPTYLCQNPYVVTPLSWNSYSPYGNTALLDGVGDAITKFQRLSDANDVNTSFLVVAITDGEENNSVNFNPSRLNALMSLVQQPDQRLPLPASRWTLAFMVPPQTKQNFCRQFSIEPGNVREWEQTDIGITQATHATSKSMDTYFTSRARGATSSTSFYADMSNVSTADVQANLVDVSSQVHIWTVPMPSHDIEIRHFCEQQSGRPFLRGAAFYELTKSEKEVQDYKQILIRDRQTGAIYGGDSARQLLNLGNVYGTIRLKPGYLGKWDVFIQSTSYTRKLPANSRVIYCPLVGTPLNTGPSAGGVVQPLAQPTAAVVPFPTVVAPPPIAQAPAFAAKKVHQLVKKTPGTSGRKPQRVCKGSCRKRRVLGVSNMCKPCSIAARCAF